MEPVSILLLSGLGLLFLGGKKKKGLSTTSGAKLRRVELAPGVKLSSAQVDWLEKVALEADIYSLYVTSGQRSAEQQAQAMWQKYRFGGKQALIDLYKDDEAIAALVATNVNEWPEKIAQLAKEGHVLSNHLEGNSADLSTRLMSGEAKDDLLMALTANGGRVLDEGTHYHVDFPTY